MTQAVQPTLPPLPRAVQAQMRRVHALTETKHPDSGATPPAPSAQASGEPLAVTIAAPAPAAAAPTPAATPAAPAAPTATANAADPRESDPAYWRHRFKVNEGMLRSQQERHAAELERRDAQLDELRARVRELESSARTTTSTKVDIAAFFTPEQIERFGEDQCQVMAATAIKAAGEQAQKLIDAEIAPIRERSKADAQRAEDAKETAFWDRLTELYPAWQDTNANQAWLDWLREEDDETALPRQSILDSHRKARNAEGVAKVFRQFEKSQARPTPPVVPAPSAGGGEQVVPAVTSSKGYPTREEIRDYHKRAATIRNPRDPRFVTDKERAEFEARLRLPQPA